MAETLNKLSEALIAGQIDRVLSLTREALDNGHSGQEVLADGLLAGMGVVGERFKTGKMYIPEVLRCAKAMKSAMEILRPHLGDAETHTVGTFVIGTVKGDLHDIGKNLVAIIFEGAGFKVVNLGIDLDPQVFVGAVKEHQPDILGLSALLTTTMPEMRTVIDALERAGVRDRVKIIVGGAPVTAEFADKIGADGYGPNVATAVELAKRWVA